MKDKSSALIQEKIVPGVENFPVEFFQWGLTADHYDTSEAHGHAFEELLLFQRGGGFHDLGGLSYPITDHSLHLVPSGTQHLVRRAGNSSGGTVVFKRSFIFEEPLLPFKDLALWQPRLPVVALDTATFREIWEIYRIALAETRQMRHYYRRQIFLSWFNTLLVKVAEAYRANGLMDAPAAGSEQITSFITLVNQHYIEQKSVSFYADRLCISAQHLYALCRHHLQKSPQLFIESRVANEGVRQLLHRGQSVKTVAFGLGFADPAYFSRFIKKMTGKTPSDWQRQA